MISKSSLIRELFRKKRVPISIAHLFERELENEQIRQAMMQFKDPDEVDMDPSFTTLFDDDFKVGVGGVTKKTFTLVYGSWINLCNHKREPVSFHYAHILCL